jgi:tetratricopeptide (TPR) repeat protein
MSSEPIMADVSLAQNRLPVTETARARFLPGVIIVLAALAAYHNSFTGPFVLDDVSSITENLRIRHLWPIWDALSPPVSSMVAGRPVVNLSLAINYALGGLAVWGYHALNLAIHILAGLTLFGVVRRTLLRPALRERLGASAAGLALAVAVLWTVHPLQTEAVTYVSERAESLMGLFYLLTLYGFVRGAESPRPGLWFGLSVVACLLGMASKEVMVTAPLMVLLYDRTFVSRSFREAWGRHRRLYVWLASTWLLLGGLMVGLPYRTVGFGHGITWWAYALTECRAVTHYLRLALWPHPLVFDYGNGITIWHVTDVASSGLILALLVASVLVALRRQPAIGFVGIWFLVILAPASSVVPVGGQPMAEHRMYLPLAAVVTLVVLGGHALLGRRSVAVFLALAVGLGFLTARRNEDYRTELSIWNDTISKCPNNARAYCNLGLALLHTGKVREAIDYYEQSLQLDPYSAVGHNNLGNALRRVGRVDEAISQYEQAVRLDPELAAAHYDLAVTLKQVGRVDEAIRHYQEAVRIDPDLARAQNNLGNALLQSGKIEEAIGHLEQAIRIAPGYVEAYNNLGNALLLAGNVAEAVRQYQRALQIAPNDAAAHYNLGMLLADQGKGEEAISHLRSAVKLQPASKPFAQALEELERRQAAEKRN